MTNHNVRREVYAMMPGAWAQQDDNGGWEIVNANRDDLPVVGWGLTADKAWASALRSLRRADVIAAIVRGLR